MKYIQFFNEVNNLDNPDNQMKMAVGYHVHCMKEAGKFISSELDKRLVKVRDELIEFNNDEEINKSITSYNNKVSRDRLIMETEFKKLVDKSNIIKYHLDGKARLDELTKHHFPNGYAEDLKYVQRKYVSVLDKEEYNHSHRIFAEKALQLKTIYKEVLTEYGNIDVDNLKEIKELEKYYSKRAVKK